MLAARTSGSLVSSAFDAGAGSIWQTLAWNASTPAGTTVRVRTRTAASSAGLAGATWSAWSTVSGASIPDPGGRWLQYEGELATSDSSVTPVLNDVTATYAQDTTKPVVTVPADITVPATGSSGKAVTFTATAVDDIDGDLTPVCTPASGSTFPVGPTTVTCTATDTANNTGSNTFTVTVNDSTKPVVTVPGDMTVVASGSGGAVVTFTASAVDAVDGALTPTCTPVSGSLFPVGVTSVTCTATDAASNIGSNTFTVTVNAAAAVVDSTAPVVTVPADMTVAAAGLAGAVVTFSASAVDDVNGVVSPSCVPVSGGLFPVGATSVTCTATDAAGNAGSKGFVVTVTAPTALVKVKAVSSGSELRVDVNPNKGSKYWTFQVQRKKADGSWKSLKTYRTWGSKEIRTVNLGKGTYRVWVNPKFGYQGIMSAEVRLKR
jgi:hypothetical protein